MTGESDAIDGTVECTDERYVESKNIAYMTTLITNGQGKGIVIETGDKTMMGSIAGLTSETTQKETTLQLELKRFIKIVVIASLIMGTACVIAWAAWLRTSYPDYIDVSSMLVNVISVMIAFIPEGLPVCVTLALLLIAKRMGKYNVLVKELSTIETLSCVNVIASDKTGTLTQNKMFVASASAGLFRFDLNELKNQQSLDTRCIGFDQLIAACYLCIDENGDIKEITEEDMASLVELQNDWCSHGQRVLLICKNTIDFAHIENSEMSVADIEEIAIKRNDFCLVGLVGIIDPPREGITDVVNVW